MSDTPVTPAAFGRRINWLMVALVASLAVNLLVAGAVAARWYVGMGPERHARLTQSQLIPRFFFRDLDRTRRAELLTAFRGQDKAIREGRAAVKAQVAALAAALEAEPYDPARVKAAVEGFTAQSEALFMAGNAAATALLDQLTPAERKLLAQRLRTRGDHGHGMTDGAGKPD